MKFSTIAVAIGVCLMLATLSNCQECSDVMCKMYCGHGFKKDANGCDICECNVQTEIRQGQCPQIAEGMAGSCDEACAHDGECPNNQKCCSNGCGHACVDIVRDGFCPVPDSVDGTPDVGSCAEMCTEDSECTNSTHKCCVNACSGHSCVAPDTEKRGSCPIGQLAEGSLGLCAEVCARDEDCPDLQKCCSNGCGHVCITPTDLPEVHLGECPEPPQGVDGVCADVCENDGTCSDSQKCCRNGCGAYSCTEAINVPVKCPDVMCLRWCAYGLKKDNDGCDICDCAEQKEIHEGECPVMSNDQVGACMEACQHDGNCADTEKCCSNGCGHVCVASITPDSEGCPINTHPEGEQQLGACVQECTEDSDCTTAGELCCFNGCGRTCTKSTTVRDGECPTGDLELGWSGVCVEMCNNDGQCTTNQKCCSNGCGHVCITVQKPPESCPDVVCQIFCEYGNKKDNNGCITCDCQEPGDAGVERPGECPIGLLPEGISGICSELCSTDDDCMDKSQKCCSNGCGHVCTDALNVGPQCPPVLCTLYCENGLKKDDNGCDVCMCNEEQKCGEIKCLMHCPYGYKEDEYGCNICQCEEKPSKCPEVTVCSNFCIYGFQRDSEGCEVCDCTTSAAASLVKDGTCPAVTGDEDPGSCADLCDNDDECAGEEKCCNNGCGHVCMSADGANVLVSPVILIVFTLSSLLAASKL